MVLKYTTPHQSTNMSASSQTTTTTTIDSASIEIHNVAFPAGVISSVLARGQDTDTDTDIDTDKYASLAIKASKSSILTKPIFLNFSIDSSGSMDDACKDGRSKMQHIKHTASNMIRFLSANEEANVFIRMVCFSDYVKMVIPTTKVDKANVGALLAQIQTLYPSGGTNIESALSDCEDAIHEHLGKYPDHAVSHIFMTDGDATAGMVDGDYLASIVPTVGSHTFIAFGLNHKASTMAKLGNAHRNSSNWLIDQLENAGLVYGEILNNELFKTLENVEISMTDGLIYDYTAGCFVEKLYAGDFVSEATKTYHVLAFNDRVKAKITGITMDGHGYVRVIDCIPDLIDAQGVPVPVDLTEQIFRLQTQQFMFKSKTFRYKPPPMRSLWTHHVPQGFMQRQIACGPEDFDSCPFDPLDYEDHFLVPNEVDPVPSAAGSDTGGASELFRKDLTDFLQTMKTYMKEKNKEDDAFITGLCDDISLTLATFGTHKHELCVGARETSQGRQQAYNPTDFDLVDAMPDTPQLHKVSRGITTSYLTPSARNTMRAVSQPMESEGYPDFDEN